MNILIYHPSLLPALNYGGTERVVMWLAQALQTLGHRVWVAAYPESQMPPGISLFPVEKGKELRFDSRESTLPAKKKPPLDVVHFMAPPSENEIAYWNLPYIVTVHGNGKSGEKFSKNTVFLSQNHAKRHHSDVFVYNGVNPDEYKIQENRSEKRNHYLFLSKTGWKVKNLKGAIDLCLRANVPLDIAGGNRPFRTHIKSVFQKGIHWIGPVNNSAKTNLLNHAKALLFPVLWDEPFGLVVIEALLAGCPVIATRRGSLPELVPADVGILFDWASEQETIIELLKSKIFPWDSSRSRTMCREWAAENFNHIKMARSYLALYEKVIARQTLQLKEPFVGL